MYGKIFLNCNKDYVYEIINQQFPINVELKINIKYCQIRNQSIPWTKHKKNVFIMKSISGQVILLFNQVKDIYLILRRTHTFPIK